MKFSQSWLQEVLDADLSTDILSHQLTMAGLEVDGIEKIAGDFTGIKVGHIVECGPHPDADKLQVTKVDIGENELLTIVCGAKNARLGLKVAVATVGAVLPGDFKIKKAKLRGVESFGMICSVSEMGLADTADGIMELPADAPIGDDIRDYLDLNDVAIEIDLTANRGDCLSLRGIAREVATINDLPQTAFQAPVIEEATKDSRTITVSDPSACPKYCGRVITAIDAKAQTPIWMQELLRRSGLRPIHPVVDVTNYVMLLLGQPMHAFDASLLKGEIDIRLAKAGEKLTLLDENEATLTDEHLVIADDSGAIAVAGIMGGQSTAVTEKTCDVFLESAFFTPSAIRGRARKLGLNTDSSQRFERGVDPEITELALALATQLILDIAGGAAGPVVQITSDEHLPMAHDISLRYAQIQRLLGITLKKSKVMDILVSLGCEASDQGESLQVKTPAWRFDLTIEVDLIEEIARIYGIDQIETKLPVAQLTGEFEQSEYELSKNDLKGRLVARDFCEAITYSFIDPKHHAVVSQETPLLIQNPISQDLSAMRTTLLPGLLNVLAHNLKRQQERLRFFEVGKVFVEDQEIERLSAVICGPVDRINPHANRVADFFDLKADLEALLGWPAELNDDFDISFLHPGQSALVTLGGELMGWIGQVHPSVLKSFKIKHKVFAFECDMRLLREQELPIFEAVSKYPSIKRDIAIVLDEAIAAADVMDCVYDHAGDQLQLVDVFDQYQGENIEAGKKSLALSLVLQDAEKTLSEEDITTLMDRVLQGLHSELNATLRD